MLCYVFIMPFQILSSVEDKAQHDQAAKRNPDAKLETELKFMITINFIAETSFRTPQDKNPLSRKNKNETKQNKTSNQTMNHVCRL